jgi:hypothetical protein
MEPHGVMHGLMLLFRPRMNRMLGELPKNLRRVIEAEPRPSHVPLEASIRSKD